MPRALNNPDFFFYGSGLWEVGVGGGKWGRRWAVVRGRWYGEWEVDLQITHIRNQGHVCKNEEKKHNFYFTSSFF